MNRYRVAHRTGFRYSQPVIASYNEVRMLPVADNSQIIFSSSLEINPRPLSHEYLDYFGTRVVMFEILQQHQELEISSETVVELRPSQQGCEPITWDELASQTARNLELTDCVQISRRTRIPADLVKAASKIAQSSADPNVAAMQICELVHKSMKYEFGVTGVQSSASDAWAKRTGVCQDFAHVAIGALRSVGIPARYVSGYLHPKVQPVIGESVVGESHAWVEWYSGSWVANDPTNNLSFPDRHVVVGRGRDYDDVPPLRGVFASTGDSQLFVEVEITREA